MKWEEEGEPSEYEEVIDKMQSEALLLESGMREVLFTETHGQVSIGRGLTRHLLDR